MYMYVCLHVSMHRNVTSVFGLLAGYLVSQNSFPAAGGLLETDIRMDDLRRLGRSRE